jgi:hypothetical protein
MIGIFTPFAIHRDPATLPFGTTLGESHLDRAVDAESVDFRCVWFN